MVQLCFTNNFVEEQAYKISKIIKEKSVYKFDRVIYANNNNDEYLDSEWDKKSLITKIVLKDNNNQEYVIQPNHIGLKFAQGEIPFKKYTKLQKRDDKQGIWIFVFSVVPLLLLFSIIRMFLI
ncbi:hypothetical protein [Niallia sp. FSL R7-0271]|uniref:hypothetical protein n=1 Tax=Niallia sp. FSL R7-0271 TaxID=2921678 RepID=UPI0030FB63E8